MNVKETSIQKHLRIKSSGLARYKKDYLSYTKELLSDQERLQKSKDEAKDEITIKQQEQVVVETKTMIDNSRKQIIIGLEELQRFIEENEDDQGMKDGEQWKKVEEIIENTKNFIDTNLNI